MTLDPQVKEFLDILAAKDLTPTPREFDVLGLGAVAVDELLYVKSYPTAETKTRVQRRQRQCGGQTGTALVAAARYGARTAYAGLLGRDALTEEVIRNFAREGIETRWAPVSDEACPAYSTIVVDMAAKTRTVFASVEGHLGAAPDLPDPAVVRAAKVLLIDHHGTEGSLRASRIARACGRSVVADFERDPGPPFDRLLDQVDHLILSKGFAVCLTGTPDVETAIAALAAATRQLVAVTCGADGCFYASAPDFHKIRHQQAFQVDVLDTTGCGDVFHGVYAAALAAGTEPAMRIRLAAAAAAIKAGKPGGQAGIPGRSMIERFLANQL